MFVSFVRGVCSKELKTIKEEQAKFNSINSSIVSVKVMVTDSSCFLRCLLLRFLLIFFTFTSVMPPVCCRRFLQFS